jgi:hypothetical protein
LAGAGSDAGKGRLVFRRIIAALIAECFTPRLRYGGSSLGYHFSSVLAGGPAPLIATAVIRPEPGEWYPRMPERLGEEELADWRAGGDAVYQLAAPTVGPRLAVVDG